MNYQIELAEKVLFSELEILDFFEFDESLCLKIPENPDYNAIKFPKNSKSIIKLEIGNNCLVTPRNVKISLL